MKYGLVIEYDRDKITKINDVRLYKADDWETNRSSSNISRVIYNTKEEAVKCAKKFKRGWEEIIKQGE